MTDVTAVLVLFHLHSRYLVQILVHSKFDLVRSVFVQFATRTVAQMVFEMISSVVISKEIMTKAAFLFKVTHLIKTF